MAASFKQEYKEFSYYIPMQGDDTVKKRFLISVFAPYLNKFDQTFLDINNTTLNDE